MTRTLPFELDHLPRGWQIARLGTLFDERKEVVSDADYEPLSVTKEGVVPLLATAARTGNGDGRKLVRSGDLVINSRSDRKGSSGLSSVDGSVSPIYTVLTPRPEIEPVYAHHLIRSIPFQEEFYRWGSGIVADLWSTRYASMKRIQLPLPPAHEQRAIAGLLEEEAIRANTLKAALSELEKQRDALLQEVAVGRFVDRPTHALGRYLRRLERPAPQDGEVVTTYRDGQVTRRSNRREDGYTMSELEHDYQGVMAGDLVFHALDGFAGAVGVSDSEGKCSPVYHVCVEMDDSVDLGFMAYLLRALGLSGFLTAYAWSVRQRSVDYRNWRLFAALPIRVPALAEQRRVVERIAHVDAIIGSAKGAIDVMRERRMALASAAVTGLVDPETGAGRTQVGRGSA